MARMERMQSASNDVGMNTRPTEGFSIDLRQQLQILWGRRRMILSVVTGVIVVTWLVLMQFTPIFAGNATVMIDTRKTRVLDLKEVITTSQPQLTTVLSEVEVIRSRNVATRVADALNLYQDPEFNASLRPKGSTILASIRDFVSALTGAVKPELTPEAAEKRMRANVVTALNAKVSAVPVPQSMVINLSVRSTDPAKAALLTNTLAEQYVLDQLNSKFEATRNASDWLNQRLEGLRETVVQAERAVAQYRASSGLIDSNGIRPAQQQLAELNTQLIQTQGRRSELQAKVARLETLIKSRRGAEAAEEMLESPLIQRLREQEASLMREISDMMTRYGDKHPKLIKGNGELAELRAKINIEAAKLAQGVSNEYNVVRARENALQDNIRRLEATVVNQNRSEVRLHELEREAQANRTLYENFLNRFKETSEQEQVQQPDARIISRAEAPYSPAFPRKGLVLVAMSMVGLLLGGFLALVLERLDNTFRSREMLEEQTGVPAIGMIPYVNKKPVVQYLFDRPTSAFAEALRGLWVSLSHSDGTRQIRILAITSSFPGEGKSMTALSLARTVALLGQRVLLIDCDLRRSAVASMLDLKPLHCLDDVLAGRVTAQDAVIEDPGSALSILPARSMVGVPLDILNSKAMEDLLEVVRESYDLVVLDCPPIIPVAEAQILSRLADKTVFCVLWDKTPREAVTRALRQLRGVQADLAGTILTKVQMHKQSRYGHGELGRYYGRYKGYYTD